VTSSTPDAFFLPFQLALAGRYSIDRELGRGGMGVVYLAREVHLDRLVAIKLLPPDRASIPALRERFLREARSAAKLSHPNIIPIHAVDEASGFVFFVMAFVEGITLAERVRTRGPLPSAEASRVLREVAWALAHAHARGLVHRDVKPDNILIEAATGRVLVADFGIAATAGVADTEGISGTPEFMSPEQALGRPMDARSDVYSLGATAFYTLTGRFPFDGASSTEILAKHVTALLPALAANGLPIPRKLAALVHQCLAKNPDERPASADAVADQLGLALEQRRELPLALRVFVKRTGRLDGSGTLVYPFLLATGAVAVSVFAGSAWGYGTLLAGVTVAPLLHFVGAARRLMLQGFVKADLGPAFHAALEQAREERSLGDDVVSARTRSALRFVARSSLPVWGLSLMGLVASWFRPFAHMGMFALALVAGTGTLAIVSTISHLAVEQRRRDIDTEFWARVWLGRIGKLSFSLTRKLLGSRPVAVAMTHRATELALGMAAEQLYASLPGESRTALKELPPLLARLQSDATVLRARCNDMQDALAAMDPAAEGYAELQAERDEAQARAGEALSALETIRLNLLRLHAGAMTVEGLTTHLGMAVELSAEVERLIAARDEVEGIVRYPRGAQPTPV